MPALILESNLATTRGQMIDLEERMGTQEARQMAHATDARETGRARYQRCLRVCAPHGRVLVLPAVKFRAPAARASP